LVLVGGVLKLIGIIVIYLFSVNSFAENQMVLKLGVVPQHEPRKLAAIWGDIISELSDKLGIKVELQGSKSITEFEKSFMKGEFDFAFMNPYHSILSEKYYEPILRDEKRKLYGVLVVGKNSGIKDPKDLNGKKIAFPSPNALGASLMMRALLSKKFSIKFQPVYSQTHTSTYINTVIGETAAGGGVYSTFNKQSDKVKNRLQIIYETPRVNPHPIVVHKRISKDLKEQFIKAFVEMSKLKKFQTNFSSIPMEKPVPAHSKDYDELRAMGLEDFVD
jgi:phosphonate transport system substrate-binding protein